MKKAEGRRQNLGDMNPQLLDNRYQIIKIIGSGGFGQTYLAQDTKNFNCKCVVKKLNPIANSPGTLEVAKQLFDTTWQVIEKWAI